jgi:xanthine dehydrogenase YagS FAD-binding subunit
MLAVLGTSDHCIASYPGDLAVALAALDAVIYTANPSSGRRAIPVVDLHRLPGGTPHIETILEPGELITHVEVPLSAAGTRSHYLKVRDRSSYEFASVSVAAAAEVDRDGIITDARLALGGLAAKPWRASAAEVVLRGRRLDDVAALTAAAQTALEEAKPQSQNAFKIAQARAAIPRAFEIVAAMPPLEDIPGWSAS